MTKPIIILIVVIALGVAGYMFLMDRDAADMPNNETPITEETEQEEENEETQEERTVRGTVVSVNAEQVPVDGPTLITVREANGTQAVIAVPSMGINLCAAQANIVALGDIAAGDTVEARGQVGVDGMVIPCESSAHYLRSAAE